jgi:hypothetical protein
MRAVGGSDRSCGLPLRFFADLHDPQHGSVVAKELELPLTGDPDDANARELELLSDLIADERQRSFARQLSI